MGYLLVAVGAILMIVGLMVFGVLFARKNPKKVELAVKAAKNPSDVIKIG